MSSLQLNLKAKIEYRMTKTDDGWKMEKCWDEKKKRKPVIIFIIFWILVEVEGVLVEVEGVPVHTLHCQVTQHDTS
jgi:hypothetical protein